MSSYLLTFPILSTYKYFRHLHERETIPRNDIKVKGKPISRRDGKPFPYRINEYPVLGCCLCRYADITFVQAAEIRGIANQQAMTIPQILFQISSRPFFQAGQEESHGCRNASRLPNSFSRSIRLAVSRCHSQMGRIYCSGCVKMYLPASTAIALTDQGMMYRFICSTLSGEAIR